MCRGTELAEKKVNRKMCEDIQKTLGYINTDSFKRVLAIHFLEDTKNIFYENYNELARSINSYYEHNDEKSAFEIKRTLHNYLCSNSTLIDHTRRLIKKSCPEVLTEYKDKVKSTFKDSLLCNFVKDLRNYITHNKLPLSSLRLKMAESRNFKCDVVLHSDSLKKWDRWNKKSEKFFETKNNIPVYDVFEQYTRRIESFHQWLDTKLKDYYIEDFQEYCDFNEKLFPSK